MKRLAVVQLCLVLFGLPGAIAAEDDSEAVSSEESRLYLPIASAHYWRFPSDWSLPGGPKVHGTANLRVVANMGSLVESIDTIFAGALQYDLSEFVLSPRGRREEFLYHGLYLRAAVLPRVADGWRLNFFATAGLASDFRAYGSDDIRLTAGAGALFAFSPRLKIMFGAMYSSAFYLPLVLPLLGVTYNRPPWYLGFQVPRGGALWYALSRSLQLGVHLRVVNMRYNSHSRTDGLDEITGLNIPLGLSFRAFIWRGLHARFEVGYNFQYSRILSGGARQSEFKWDGYQVSLGLGYML